MESPEREAVALAIARAGFGLPALAAPGLVLRVLSRSRGRRGDAARFFVAFFGVRELALAVLMAALRRDPVRLRPIVALGALADIGDTAFLLSDGRRGIRVEPLAAALLLTGVAGSAASAALWWQVGKSQP